MPDAAEPTQFPELNELLRRFVVRVETILGGDLLGIYLTGSFALGRGDAASDCDFLVAVEHALSGEQEQELRRLHDEVLGWPGYWASNLEGSYAPKPDLETLAALGRPWLYVDRGHREMEWSPHCNTEDVRWVLRERSPTLAGMRPREFACEVPPELLQNAMRPQIERFLDDLLTWASFDLSWTQRYAVESTSRMLYTLENGAVVSKPDALDWAEASMPEWRELVRQVRRDRFVTWNDPPAPGTAEESIAFVHDARERARLSAQ
jgi:predicted nucleotidyltransferase